MFRSRAEEGSKISLTGGRKTVKRGAPRPGDIYWASCCLKHAVLTDFKALTDSTWPLSSAMASDLKQVSYDGSIVQTRRPCVVLRVNLKNRTATLVPMATFKGRPIVELGAHYQHYSVSVGETRPWPSPDSYVLQPAPSWPLSRSKPCYALACTIEVGWKHIQEQYIWPVRKESELDRALQGAGGTSDTLGGAPPALMDGEEIINSFVVQTQDLVILGDVVEKRKNKLKNKSRVEVQAMQESYSAVQKSYPSSRRQSGGEPE